MSKELPEPADLYGRALTRAFDEAMEKLDEQHRIFVNHYLETDSAMAAARAAGYSVPQSSGYKLRHHPDVARAIALGQRMQCEELTELQWKNEVRRIALANAADYQEADGSITKGKLTREQGAAVKRIRDRVIPRKGQEPEIVREIELHSKLDALRMEGQRLALLSGEDAGGDSTPSVVVNVPIAAMFGGAKEKPPAGLPEGAGGGGEGDG